MRVLKRLKQHEKNHTKCEVCEKCKPEIDFIAQHAGKFRICKPCKTHINRLTRYHITPDDYQALLEKQQKRCAICECDLELERNKTAVDHCHNTGQVRGVLCRACNTGLGRFMDKAALLLKAMNYLKNPPADGVVTTTKITKKYQYMRGYLKAKSCDTLLDK